LADANVGEPDSTGMFEISVDAADHEAALERIWNAVAAAGADEHIVFVEHPDLPQHWRRRELGTDTDRSPDAARKRT
jgi:hypothetical protein